MELSLFSRDRSARATAAAFSHNTLDAALCLGVCDKIVPGQYGFGRELLAAFRHHVGRAEQGASACLTAAAVA